jgi:alginate O-acetyltransferase complex protein AlgI
VREKEQVLFNSLNFFFFFIFVYAAYGCLYRYFRAQNVLLLIASYVFYGTWDWRFVILLATITIVNFYLGNRIFQAENPRQRKTYLISALVTSLLCLGFFKYFNFFTSSAIAILNLIGIKADFVSLNIILPIGISFYTLQALTYPLDLYYGKLRRTSGLIEFAAFTSFFPQLLSGPIERASNMLSQFSRPRSFSIENLNAAIYLILWGLYKKIVIADNIALIANRIFDNYTQYVGFDLIVGVIAFTIQLYCDFSGYSDIARGLAKLLGFEIMINFKLPYMATNTSEFWRRWHISLTSWLRDYLWWNMVKKIPMTGGLGTKVKWNASLLAVFLISGLWHGAAWNFVLWGGFHGALLIIYNLYSNRRSRDRNQSKKVWWRQGIAMLTTFCCISIGWVFFRAESLVQIADMLKEMCRWTTPLTLDFAFKLIFFSMPLIIIELWQHFSRNLLVLLQRPVLIRASIYSYLILWLIIFGHRNSTRFLYFRF